MKTLWSREEDTRHDFYRPAAMARMVAGLDADGMPLAWHVRLTGPSIRGTLTPFALSGVDLQAQEGFLDDMQYDVPNYLADYAMRNTHVPVGFWRCVNQSQNGFFKESFIDELAHLAQADPYAYRRTFTAAVAEVAVGSGGEVRMQRIVCAIDCGHVVNPLTAAMQTEGCVVYGLTAALYGEITIRDGRVEQSNFNDYPMLRIDGMPKVETVLVPSGGFWGGIGEPPLSVVAPAFCNAIFAATGKRIRSLPVKNHDLRKA